MVLSTRSAAKFEKAPCTTPHTLCTTTANTTNKTNNIKSTTKILNTNNSTSSDFFYITCQRLYAIFSIWEYYGPLYPYFNDTTNYKICYFKCKFSEVSIISILQQIIGNSIATIATLCPVSLKHEE